MRALIIGLLLLLPVAAWGGEKKWYTMNEKDTPRKCVVAHGSPAEFIKEVKQKGLSYTVKDDSNEAGKKPDMVMVTVEDTVSAVFFRNLKYCKTAASLLDYKDKAETDRYQ